MKLREQAGGKGIDGKVGGVVRLAFMLPNNGAKTGLDCGGGKSWVGRRGGKEPQRELERVRSVERVKSLHELCVPVSLPVPAHSRQQWCAVEVEHSGRQYG